MAGLFGIRSRRHVGFTGTQAGMTSVQRDKVKKKLARLFEQGYTDFHHGDCVGADAEAPAIAKELGYTTHCHPCDISAKRAFTTNDYTYDVLKPLNRNKHIVEESELMIATPFTFEEQQRSGTWSTVRYSRKTNTQLVLIAPDGKIHLCGSLSST